LRCSFVCFIFRLCRDWQQAQIEQGGRAWDGGFVEANVATLIFEVEVVLLGGGGQEWTPLAVGFGDNFVGWRGGFGGVDWVDAKVGSGDGEVGEGAVLEAGDQAGDGGGGDWRDLGGGGCGAGDELVHLGEGRWVEGEFAVVEVGEDDVGGSGERRAFVGDAGGGVGFAEGDAAGLGVLVELVAVGPRSCRRSYG